MAGSKPKDPLDTLQLMVNDVLIQAARTLKNMSKDGTKGSGQTPSNLKPKLDATSRIFHAALDDLESEIIAAKSVFMRDLSIVRHKKAAATSQASAPMGQPVPQKQAPAAPMSIDMEFPNLTSGAVNRQQQQQQEQEQGTIMSKANSNNGTQNKRDIRPAAPFPDMGMGMSMEDASPAASVDVAGSTKDKAACANPPGRGTPKPACVAYSRPQPNPTKTPVAPMGTGPALLTAAATPQPSPTPPLPNPASSASKTINTKTTVTSGPEVPTLPFTDMEFSLVPSSDPPELTSLSVPGGGPAAPTALMGDMNTFNITSAPPPPQPQPQQQTSQKTAAAPASMGGGIVVASTAGPHTTTTMTTMPANPSDTAAQQKLPLTAPAKTTVDDMYTLGDLDTDIGGGGPGGTDTNFDDVFTSYDPSYFGVE